MKYRTLQRQVGYLAHEEDYEVWELKLIYPGMSVKNIVRAIEKYRRQFCEK